MKHIHVNGHKNNIPNVPGELGGCASKYSIAISTVSKDGRGMVLLAQKSRNN